MNRYIKALVLVVTLGLVATSLAACGNCQAAGNNYGQAGRCGMTAGF